MDESSRRIHGEASKPARPCPSCGSQVHDLVKSWDATPRTRREGPHIQVVISLWVCSRCGHRFRTATRTWLS